MKESETMENLTREQINFMDDARANLLHELGMSVSVDHLLIINGAHTAGFKAGLEYTAAALAALRADNEALGEALRPFAACAEVWEDSDWARVIHWSRKNVDGEPDLKITVDDLMTARAARAKAE